MNNMKVLAVIPARFASTRFPGKPLAIIGGKPMVQLVYEKCHSSNLFVKTVVATDDERIKDTVLSFEGEVVMTKDSHESGTDRCFETLDLLTDEYDAIVNVQGDEPFIGIDSLEKVVELLQGESDIATLAVKAISLKQVLDSNKVKAVISEAGRAIYFSRSPVPFVRDIPQEKWIENRDFFIHIGIYGFKTRVIPEIKKLNISSLEKTEKLEQLRWIENDFTIFCNVVDEMPFGVDTPSDLEEANEKLNLN